MEVSEQVSSMCASIYHINIEINIIMEKYQKITYVLHLYLYEC